MTLSLPLFDGLTLTVAERSPDGAGYPTARLQRGFLLWDGGEELAEEGVGFGLPVIKRGIETVFPGYVELDCRYEGPVRCVTAAYAMNLVERLAGPGSASLTSRPLYAAKNSLAALHRRAPALRGPLTATSSALRRTFGWVTTFEETARATTLTLTYTVHGDEGRVGVALALPDPVANGVTEVVVMNEQGGRRFDAYTDADGISLSGNEIGTWDLVSAERASFVSADHRVAFSLGQVDGARLYRGRELIGARVAWSGFGYAIPPTLERFGYDVSIERRA